MLVGGLALIGVLILTGTLDLRLGRESVTADEQLLGAELGVSVAVKVEEARSIPPLEFEGLLEQGLELLCCCS